MYRRVPALEKLERLTGFRPKTTLPAIIDRVAAHMVQRKQRELVGRAPRTGRYSGLIERHSESGFRLGMDGFGDLTWLTRRGIAEPSFCGERIARSGGCELLSVVSLAIRTAIAWEISMSTVTEVREIAAHMRRRRLRHGRVSERRSLSGCAWQPCFFLIPADRQSVGTR